MGGMYDSFRTDKEAEQKGIILDYGDFRITVARAGGSNKNYQKTLERLTRPVRRLIQTDNLDNEKSRDILKQAYATTIVIDWETKNGTGEWVKGIEPKTGKKLLPVNKDNIKATFDDLPDLFDDVMEQAGKSTLFKVSLREEASKNL